MAAQRVAVIGAGAAGLAAAKNMLADPAHFSCTVFEQTGVVGGTWVYTDRVGCDEFGLLIHTSMYKSLRTNLPKELMGFSDFEFPKQAKSFLPAVDVAKFLSDYADHFNVLPCVRFYHHVKKVTPGDCGQWSISVINLKSNEEETYIFDAVMVCNGHNSVPVMPRYPGMDSFPGQIMHSHDYREPSMFEGKRVVMVGMGPSAFDMSVEVAKVATLLVMSHHYKRPLCYPYPAHARFAGDVTRLEGGWVHFSDGSSCEADVLLLCTGYRHAFPFLAPECGISVRESGLVTPLYKHLVHIHRPSMALIGVPHMFCCNFRHLEMQEHP